MLGKTQTVVFCILDFRTSGHSLIKENCHNSRTSDDIYMKLGPVTERDRRNKTALKKVDDDFMSQNCEHKTVKTRSTFL